MLPEKGIERATRGALRWSGPLLGFLGIAAICVLVLETRSERSLTTWWILNSGLSADRVVPLAGLGVAIALAHGRHVAVALATFLLGVVLGISFRDWYLSLMADVPGVTKHLFLTGPVSALAAGLPLILPARVRPWILPVAAMLIGAMLGVATTLTDPTLHDPAIPMIAILIALWIVAAIGLSGHAFWHGWFPIAARILGSWLIAIGLLLGGAAIGARSPVPAPLPPPPPPLTEGRANRLGTPFPGVMRQGERSRNALRPPLP